MSVLAREAATNTQSTTRMHSITRSLSLPTRVATASSLADHHHPNPRCVVDERDFSLGRPVGWHDHAYRTCLSVSKANKRRACRLYSEGAIWVWRRGVECGEPARSGWSLILARAISTAFQAQTWNSTVAWMNHERLDCGLIADRAVSHGVPHGVSNVVGLGSIEQCIRPTLCLACGTIVVP